MNMKQILSDIFRRSGLQIGTTVVSMVHKQQQAVHKTEEKRFIQKKGVCMNKSW